MKHIKPEIIVKALLVTLIIILLTGFSQGQNLLPPGPIYKEVRANVLFTTIPSSHTIKNIKWHFNGREVITYDHPGPENVNAMYRGRVSLNYSTGELVLKTLTMADSGQYSLTLTYESGIGFIDHILLQVFEPVFIVGISGPVGNVIENRDANFTCKGNGSISMIVWKKEGLILAPSTSLTFLEDNKTMVISPVTRSDSGYYQCELSNPVSNSTANYRLTVNYGPDVRILGAQTLEEGADILLLCSPDSVPTASVTWTVNGMPAGNTLLYVTENSKPSNSGDYNCTCKNDVTGITAFAVQVVKVRAVSSRLDPGAEAGIVIGLVLLAVIIYILVKLFIKDSRTKTRNTAPVTRTESQTNETFDHGYEAPDNLTQEIRTPPPPRNSAPPLPTNRKLNNPGMYCN